MYWIVFDYSPDFLKSTDRLVKSEFISWILGWFIDQNNSHRELHRVLMETRGTICTVRFAQSGPNVFASWSSSGLWTGEDRSVLQENKGYITNLVSEITWSIESAIKQRSTGDFQMSKVNSFSTNHSSGNHSSTEGACPLLGKILAYIAL